MQNKIIGIVGPKGSGKSHKAAQLFSLCPRAAVFQIVREDRAFVTGATDIYTAAIRDFAKSLGQKNFRTIYLLDEGGTHVEGNRIVYDDFDWFVRACFHRRDMAMMIDEAHELCTLHNCPVYFREAIIMGRHKWLDIIYCAQRLADIFPNLRANSDEFYFWAIHEPRDIEAIAERCGKDVAAQVQGLRATEDQRREGGAIVPGQVLHWTRWRGVEGVTT